MRISIREWKFRSVALFRQSVGGLLALAFAAGALFAAEPQASTAIPPTPPIAEQIAAALAAAPDDRRAGAQVLGYTTEGGKVVVSVLRPGSNDLVCLGDRPGDDRFSVACYHQTLEPFMRRGRELEAEGVAGDERMKRRWAEADAGTLAMPKLPAALYVLTGTRFDAAAGKVVDPYLRYVVYTPYATQETTGLPLSPPGPGGPWLMFPGTAGAHIMITPPKESPAQKNPGRENSAQENPVQTNPPQESVPKADSMRPKVEATRTLVEAAPDRGFHYPYLLVVPTAAPAGAPAFLLVEPNNTGRLSDDLAVHIAAARELAKTAIGGYLARELVVPLLIPVFPRPETQWELYTHQLDRDTLAIPDGPMRRLDLQLLAMIADARGRLASQGRPVAAKVLMTGFSASGSFANRFTAMHPEHVQAVAAGGLNGILILPVESLGGKALPYPLGVADLASASGRAFDAASWRKVPQFLYMGALDDNDAVQFDDGYAPTEKAIVDAVIGAKMQPDRWEHCQRIYREADADATFNTFKEVGHFTTREVNEAIRDFFRAHLTPPH